MIKAIGSEMVLNLTLDFVPNLSIRIVKNRAQRIRPAFLICGVFCVIEIAADPSYNQDQDNRASTSSFIKKLK